MRLDKALVEAGLVKTRSQALQHIQFGHVRYFEKVITKPSFQVQDLEGLELSGDIYVGRGAQKLLKALEDFPLSLKNCVAADVGASTGGFTEVLLNNGIQKVYAIDVGHDQLAPKLKEDERVVNFEGSHIRSFATGEKALPENVDIVVADLSFISLKSCLEGMISLLKPQAELVTLVKPQFEVGKEGVGRGGIVRDSQKHFECLVDLAEEFSHRGFHLLAATVSPITGKAGNREYLFYLRRFGGNDTLPLLISRQELWDLTQQNAKMRGQK